jgi:hypothetical protein
MTTTALGSRPCPGGRWGLRAQRTAAVASVGAITSTGSSCNCSRIAAGAPHWGGGLWGDGCRQCRAFGPALLTLLWRAAARQEKAMRCGGVVALSRHRWSLRKCRGSCGTAWVCRHDKDGTHRPNPRTQSDQCVHATRLTTRGRVFVRTHASIRQGTPVWPNPFGKNWTVVTTQRDQGLVVQSACWWVAGWGGRGAFFSRFSQDSRSSPSCR